MPLGLASTEGLGLGVRAKRAGEGGAEEGSVGVSRALKERIGVAPTMSKRVVFERVPMPAGELSFRADEDWPNPPAPALN